MTALEKWSVPQEDGGGRGEPCPKPRRRHHVPAADLSLPHRLVQRQRNAPGARVPELGDIDDDPLLRNPQPRRRRVQDPRVGLVKHQPVDLVHGLQSGLLHRLLHNGRDGPDRPLEDVLPRHSEVRVAPVPPPSVRSQAGAGLVPSAGERSVQVLPPLPVALHVKAQQAATPLARALRPQHARPTPVAEEHARVPVRPVHEPGEGVPADDQDLLVRPGPDVLGARDEADDKSGAGAGEVEARRLRGANRGLDRARGPEEVVRGGGRQDDQVQLRGVHPAGREGPRRGRGGDVREFLAVG
mmetsp:Transcript_8347/g.30133  ORF Transcript_8347/g.30133 Transcript_8347/m.30133 type:complete len:299 (+) Transcript_8347:63-959(+)